MIRRPKNDAKNLAILEHNVEVSSMPAS